jgi:hypothetical protein
VETAIGPTVDFSGGAFWFRTGAATPFDLSNISIILEI